MERRIPTLDEFINESQIINESIYEVTYAEVTLKNLVFLASNYVKNPTIIYGVPTKNFKLQLNVEEMGFKCNLSTPYKYRELWSRTQARLWANRPVILMYDDINGDYVYFDGHSNHIGIGVNTIVSKLSDFIKSLKDKKELNSEDDFQSVVPTLLAWNSDMIKK
ncbi:MAG: hypothetical protein WC979_01880 [Candidatus Pacearchaeota archaeon]|jgi:hypothetical protein|nr:hypothetical protein [Clostridia bacterium]